MRFPTAAPIRMEFPNRPPPLPLPLPRHPPRCLLEGWRTGVRLDRHPRCRPYPHSLLRPRRHPPTPSPPDLALAPPHGRAIHRNLHIYQPGKNEPIPGGFLLHPDGTVGFHIAAYDTTRPLIIDPQLIWADDAGTLHPRIDDIASSIAVDPAGNVDITGTSISNSIPLVKPVQNQCDNNHCAFLTKLSPDGATVLYSIYLGHPGFSFNFPLYDGKAPIPASVVVDAEGNAYVAGAQLQSAGGFDVFIAKISPTGALLASTLIGSPGDDRATGLTLGPDGSLYIAGTTISPNFPVTPGAYQTPLTGAARFFAMKVDPKRLSVVYATVFGLYSRTRPDLNGSRYPVPRIAADPDGNAYVSSFTDCSGLEASPGAIRASCEFEELAAVGLVTKISPDGSRLLWTAMPTGSGRAYINGIAGTKETGGFTGRLAPDASRYIWSNSFGDRDSSFSLSGLALDGTGNPYLAGSGPVPTLHSMQSYSGGGFVSAIKPDGSGPIWSTHLGQGRVDALTLDAAGNVFAVGPSLNPSATFANAPIGGPASRIDVVKLTPAGEPIPIEAIVNAASYKPGLPKAGGLASLFASGLPPTEDGTGLSVTHSGGQQKVNLQVPYQSLPIASTRLELRYEGVSTYAFPSITPPGIFTLPDGAGAIQHGADYTLVTPHNPATPGETIIVYATGLGPVTGYCHVPPSLNLGRVLYAGVTPGISGVYQLNVQLPDAMTAGDTPIHIQFTECPAAPPLQPVFPVITRSNSVSLPVR